MTIRRARKIAHYWLDILGLIEWKEKLVVRWGTAEELKKEGDAVGLNLIEPEWLESTIMLKPGRTDEETEQTIVHEVLHLVIDGHKAEDTPYDPMHERALNRLADTLIALTKQE